MVQKIKRIYFIKRRTLSNILNFINEIPNTKINILFNLEKKRIRMIVSDEETTYRRMNELCEILKLRHYPQQIIENGINKAMNTPRLNNEDYLLEKLYLILSTQNPKQKEMFNILITNMDILQEGNVMKNIMNSSKLIKCKRQPPLNLKRILIRSEFNVNKINKVT